MQQQWETFLRYLMLKLFDKAILSDRIHCHSIDYFQIQPASILFFLQNSARIGGVRRRTQLLYFFFKIFTTNLLASICTICTHRDIGMLFTFYFTASLYCYFSDSSTVPRKLQTTLFIRKKHFVHDVNVRFQIPLLCEPLKTYHALKFTWHAALVGQMPFEQLFSVSAFVLTTAAVWTHSRLGFADLVQPVPLGSCKSENSTLTVK